MSNGITFEQKKQLIKNHPFFRLLEDKDIEALIELIREVSIKKGAAVVKENDLIDSIYIIAEGVTEVTRSIETADGHIPILLAKLSPGGIIGLSDVGFFSRTLRRTATVTALTDVTLLKLDSIEFSMFMLGASGLHVSLTEPAEQIIRSNFIRKLTLNEKIISDRFTKLYDTIETINIEPKQVIFQAGDRDEHVYLLTKGQVEILDHQQKPLAALQPVKLFGESGVLDLPLQTVSAVATEKSTLLKFSRKTMLEHAHVVTEAEDIKLKDSSIVSKKQDVHFHKQVVADTQPIYILSNEDKSYSIFNAAGWQIWQTADGKNTIEHIVNSVEKEFKGISKEEIMQFIAKMASRNLLYIT